MAYFVLHTDPDNASVTLTRYEEDEQGKLLERLHYYYDDDVEESGGDGDGIDLTHFATKDQIGTSWTSETCAKFDCIILHGEIVTPAPRTIVKTLSLD